MNMNQRYRIVYGTLSLTEGNLAKFCNSYEEAKDIATNLCKEHEFVRIKDNETNETLFNNETKIIH